MGKTSSAGRPMPPTNKAIMRMKSMSQKGKPSLDENRPTELVASTSTVAKKAPAKHSQCARAQVIYPIPYPCSKLHATRYPVKCAGLNKGAIMGFPSACIALAAGLTVPSK